MRPPASGPRGRRPGAPDTRAAILAAAREGFTRAGYAGTSVRAVAAAAGVDPALVHHYFGTKDALFVAALELPGDPHELFGPVLAAGADAAGEALVRVFLGVWDDPPSRLPLLTLLRGAFEPGGDLVLRTGLLPRVVGPIGTGLGLDRPQHRMTLVASQLVGLAVLRYVVRAAPVAHMSVDDLVQTYAPTLQRYLTGDLPG